ncbi:MAG: hypothetical protein KDC52_13285, partial [Ignavibacteriae bacterium]|nr:hypothetical protein [Ignavibacteriota bacterium]
YWRAPTDNDIAGFKGELDPWKDAASGRKVDKVNVSQPDQNKLIVSVDGTVAIGKSKWNETYTIYGNGVIKVAQQLFPIGDVPNDIAKIGSEMKIPNQYNKMSWYGRGPWENYLDRQTGSSVGVYSGLVDSLWTNYVRPQENGNRCDVRWVAFTNNTGEGLLAIGDPTLSVSAWPYSLQDLEQAKHISDLPHRDFITVNLDYKQMGVGGINTWSSVARPLPEFSLPSNESYNYEFYLMPYSPEMGSLDKVANFRLP